MSDTGRSKDRIPFESIHEGEAVSSWNLPAMQGQGKLVRSAKRDGKKAKVQGESIEPVNKPAKAGKLTAEELQQITDDAKRDGYAQGNREGLENGYKDGLAKGQKDGHQKAYTEARKEIEALQYQLRKVTEALFDPMEQRQTEIQNTLLEISLNLSKHILNAEIKQDPGVLYRMVEQVVEEIPLGAKFVQVYVNADDANLLKNLVKHDDWQICIDDNLSSGGCRVETDASLIDFSVEHRLEVYLQKARASTAAAKSQREPVEDYAASASQAEHISDDED